eukprot:TRINITY_DN4694_c0_g1_i1.p1 TRINITY_DN4694_c0_g1~~TRINITY_DN4694_c0_g1_i1.p1  ORF type:complete len:234 (+),score=34.77 TRINITY_DN4694_c0_g1_i1:167-868(+)
MSWVHSCAERRGESVQTDAMKVDETFTDTSASAANTSEASADVEEQILTSRLMDDSQPPFASTPRELPTVTSTSLLQDMRKEMLKLATRFDNADTNREYDLNFEVIQKLVIEIFGTERSLSQDTFNKYDHNEDGRIFAQEFIDMMVLEDYVSPDPWAEAFNTIDEDRDREISFEALVNFFRVQLNLSTQDCESVKRDIETKFDNPKGMSIELYKTIMLDLLRTDIIAYKLRDA